MAPKRNGFWYFMRDFQKREEAKGVRFEGGLREIQAHPQCSREWNQLNAEKKERYQQLAKKYNGGTVVKRTTLGDPVSINEERVQKLKEFEENMREEIKEIFSIAHLQGTIPELTFYFIHMNYFYTKISNDSVIDYIPAEYAVVEFSLLNGQVRVHHQIIRAKFELGYAREAFEISEATHKIIENMKEGENDYAVMYEKLVAFLRMNDNKKTGKLPAIYTTSKMMKIIPCLFERLTQASDAPDDTFTLYSLESLFGSMMLYTSPKFSEVTNIDLVAAGELEKESFSYTPNIECSFHQKITDSSIYCSLSIVRQWIFTICDFCCAEFNINMIPGAHIPDNDEFEIQRMSRASSLASSMHSLSISVKSATGVSSNYKPTYQLTPDEDKRRREVKTKLTIINHGESRELINKAHSDAVPSNFSGSLNSLASYDHQPRSLRIQNTLSSAMSRSVNAPSLSDANFPPIGGGRGRIISDNAKVSPVGRGRGGSSVV